MSFWRYYGPSIISSIVIPSLASGVAMWCYDYRRKRISNPESKRSSGEKMHA